MGTVATFTLRDLNRQSAKILAAVRKYGSAEITTRSGEVFTLAAKRAGGRGRREAMEIDPGIEFVERAEERAKLFREMGYVPPKPGEWDEERFNRIIAGEE
jgi:hypothetical protein